MIFNSTILMRTIMGVSDGHTMGEFLPMNTPTLSAAQALKLESTRYALIRRLGYVFRHHLVVNLQPLNVICQVMQHRLNASPVDIASMRDNVEQVERLVRTSIDSCLDVVSWLTADAQSGVAVDAGISECLANVRGSFSFRGFTLRHEESPLEVSVSRVALREVLTAALFAATDHARGLDEIAVDAKALPGGVEITLQMGRGAGESCAEQGAYRVIEWEDVHVLAASHGIGLSHRSDRLVQMRIAAA